MDSFEHRPPRHGTGTQGVRRTDRLDCAAGRRSGRRHSNLILARSEAHGTSRYRPGIRRNCDRSYRRRTPPASAMFSRLTAPVLRSAVIAHERGWHTWIANNRRRKIPTQPFLPHEAVAGTSACPKNTRRSGPKAVHSERNQKVSVFASHPHQARFQLLRRWLSCSSSSFFVSFLNDEQGRACRTHLLRVLQTCCNRRSLLDSEKLC